MNRADRIAGIVSASAALAAAAATRLDAPIEHCPGWVMSDLATHLGNVQWFWSDVLERNVVDGSETQRPPEEKPDDPCAYLLAQSQRLATALSNCDDETPVWTWHAPHQHVGFVVQRQLIEAAIHAWDGLHAVSEAKPIAINVAEVGLFEFVDVMAHYLRADQLGPTAVLLEPSDSPWRGVLFGPLTGPVDDRLVLRTPSSEMLLSFWGRGAVANPAIAESIAAVDLS
jgi:uncharacterized protein (TIGR03083 family)